MKFQSLNLKELFIKTMILAVMAVSGLMLYGYGEEAKPTAAAAPPPMPVKVANPIQEEVTEWDEYTGHFEATNSVEVRARVSGFVDKVLFKDGQKVKKGAVLYEIDPQPFMIELDKAKANYQQALTQLEQAEHNFQRVEPLLKTGAVSVEEYELRKQTVESAKASLQLTKSFIDKAELDLSYTKVRASMSGRVGKDLVNRGNLINGGSANATLLTTIVSTNPIHFYFNQSETDYLKYSRLDQTGKRGSSRKTANPVKIQLQDESDFIHQGKMDFVDNQLNRNTGTFEVRAVVPNKDGLIEPGMFGRARLLGSAKYKAILIPDELIGTNQSMKFVYTLDENNMVKAVNVDLGPLHTNGLRIVRNGLTVTDQLVINNIQKIRPGVTVSPEQGELSSPIKP